MPFRYNPRNLNESLILLGDTGGGVSCIMFKEATVGLFDVNIGKLEVLSHGMLNILQYQKKFTKQCKTSLPSQN